MSSHLNGSAKVVENFEVRNGGEVKCGTGEDWPEQKEGTGEKGAWGSNSRNTQGRGKRNEEERITL